MDKFIRVGNMIYNRDAVACIGPALGGVAVVLVGGDEHVVKDVTIDGIESQLRGHPY